MQNTQCRWQGWQGRLGELHSRIAKKYGAAPDALLPPRGRGDTQHRRPVAALEAEVQAAQERADKLLRCVRLLAVLTLPARLQLVLDCLASCQQANGWLSAFPVRHSVSTLWPPSCRPWAALSLPGLPWACAAWLG